MGVVLSGVRGRRQSGPDFSHRQLHRCSEPGGVYSAESSSLPRTPHVFCVQLSEGGKKTIKRCRGEAGDGSLVEPEGLGWWEWVRFFFFVYEVSRAPPPANT